MPHAALKVAVVSLALGALTGCVGNGAGTKASSEPAGPYTPPPPHAAAKKSAPPATKPADLSPPDRVQASELRERALQLIEGMSKSADPQTRANAVEAASKAPNRLEPVVASALADPNPAVRSVAAMAVARGPFKDLAARARPLLDDPSPHVRVSAIWAMVATGQKVDRTPVAAYLMNDPSPWVRRHAAFVLGELGDRSALPLLRAALSEAAPAGGSAQQKSFHLQIAESMAKLGDQGAREALRAALYPSRPEELEAAALAVQMLGELQDRDSIDQLIYLAEYRDRTGQQYPAEVRLGIAGALASVDVRQGGFVADEFLANANPALRAQAAFVYGQIGGRSAWEHLATLLSDPDEHVRIAAAAGILEAASRAAP